MDWLANGGTLGRAQCADESAFDLANTCLLPGPEFAALYRAGDLLEAVLLLCALLLASFGFLIVASVRIFHANIIRMLCAMTVCLYGLAGCRLVLMGAVWSRGCYLCEWQMVWL